MKIVMTNTIMIMTMTTSVRVIFCNQKQIARDDDSQQCDPIKLIYFIPQQPPSAAAENKISKFCS